MCTIFSQKYCLRGFVLFSTQSPPVYRKSCSKFEHPAYEETFECTSFVLEEWVSSAEWDWKERIWKEAIVAFVTAVFPHSGRFTLYVTFPFRHGTSLFSKTFSRVIKTDMFTLTGTSSSSLRSVPSPSPS